MWVLRGTRVRSNYPQGNYKVELIFHTRKDATSESRWYWNNYHSNWIPDGIYWEPWRMA